MGMTTCAIIIGLICAIAGIVCIIFNFERARENETFGLYVAGALLLLIAVSIFFAIGARAYVMAQA